MLDVYFGTYLWVMIILLMVGFSSVVLGIQENWNAALGTGTLCFLLMLLFHVVTPSQEQMLTQEYDDIKTSRPECAAIIDINIDSASMECLRQYRRYLEDSVSAANHYYEHFGRLKQELKR